MNWWIIILALMLLLMAVVSVFQLWIIEKLKDEKHNLSEHFNHKMKLAEKDQAHTQEMLAEVTKERDAAASNIKFLIHHYEPEIKKKDEEEE